MGRAPCCDKANVKKGPWSPEEDEKLKDFIHKHGTANNWIALPQKAGLRRCGKSCRLRWLNYLRPNIKHGHFSHEEDTIISTLYANIGSRWSIIASQLPGRTDNDIKNYWNTKLKKKIYPLQTQSLSLSSLYHHHQPSKSIINYPNPHQDNFLYSNNAQNINILAATPHGGGGGGGYYYPMKDNMLAFGGGTNEAAAPSCSSSDGSCGKDLHEITGFFQGFAAEDPLGSILDHHQLQNDLEEVKHLLSGGGGGGGGCFLFGDEENKGGEMGGMY